MVRTVFDVISPPPTFDRQPIHVEQVAASSSGAARLLLLLPAVGALSVLLAGVALAAAAEPGMLEAVASRPLAAIQVSAGLAIWTALFVIPASRAIAAVGRRRSVTIVDGVVEITDRTLLGVRLRRVRATEYVGIAHHIRASLSCLSHEIVLVHANPGLTVTLVSADRVTQRMVEDVKALLGLPEVHPRAIYERLGTSASAATGSLAPVRV